MSHELKNQLKDLGSKLGDLPSSKDSLIKLLENAAKCLSKIDQSPAKSTLKSMQPILNASVKEELMKHQDKEVKLLVVTCLCEITRITAREAPYGDDVLRDIFHLIVSTFSGLKDSSDPSFDRRVVILEMLARYKSCIGLLDLDCNELVNEVFHSFLDVASDDHPNMVLLSMQAIMVLLLEESGEISKDLIFILLSALGRDRIDVSKAARRLAMDVIRQCSRKLEPYIQQFLISSISGNSKSSDCQIDYHEIIYDIYHCAPQILSGVVPYLAGDLLTDQLATHLKAVRLVGDLFALPGLKSEANQIISVFSDRLMDSDENIRKKVVAVICDVVCHSLSSVQVKIINLVAECLQDKSLLVKTYTMERLADIYRTYNTLSQTENPPEADDFDWIPGKILRCFYDKDFRSDMIEFILWHSLFPTEFTVKERVKAWVRIFRTFGNVEEKALEKILEQKQRFQHEMRRYLSLSQASQENDPELEKKKISCFRVLSRFFIDSTVAEENFQILDELTDTKIWTIFMASIDSSVRVVQSRNYYHDLLNILGEKHRLYEFIGLLSVKCSYTLFDKKHVKEILLEASLQKTAGTAPLIKSCMNILVLLARFSPQLLNGIEDKLLQLLEDDNEIIKEGVLHILAKAGGTIREQLGVSSSSLDLILERICLEGSRGQAKYAVHALAAVTKDDGLMSLSVLYKKLVDMLEEKTNLPAVLQSLGCIAQAAMSVFETRENEIDVFIKKDILQSRPEGGIVRDYWFDRSEVCSLKIFGLKALVKSYMPVKDAHLRTGIDGLFEILRNILLYGDISSDIISSPVDKAHLRLSAAKAILRLSRHWDHKIPINLFYLTLRAVEEINYHPGKVQLLNKVHQYIKEKLLEPKYACAFFYDLAGRQGPVLQLDNRQLTDIIQMCQQGNTQQHSLPSDPNSQVIFPASILSYIIHALAHHPLCPKVDECRNIKEFEPIYRQLHLLLSVILQCNENGTAEAFINKKKDIASAVVSVFQCIKNSDDAVVPELSKNSHAICELGICVIKRITLIEEGSSGSSTLVKLPPLLYRPIETKGDPLTNEYLSWISEENALMYFESIKLEINGMVQSKMVIEDEVMEDNETDGYEVPLGKMLKRLKAKGNKTRKTKKEESPSTEVQIEHNVDVLQMVREINLDNLGNSCKYESTNGHDNDPAKLRNVQKFGKGKKRMVSGEIKYSPTGKRQRSSGQGSESSDMDEDKSPLEEGNVESTKSSFDVFSIGKKDSGTLMRRRGKGSYIQRNNKINGKDVEGPVGLVSDIKKSTYDSKSAKASIKDHKKSSITGLSKCTTKEGGIETMDLIDCRIKVWWPMDKRFYQGVVKSYDDEKKKHVVLYDDGDVEVLQLDKECWELVDNIHKVTKKAKLLKTTPLKTSLSSVHQKKKKPVTSLQQNKSPLNVSVLSKARGKRTPRTNPKSSYTLKSTLNMFVEKKKANLNIQDPEPATLSKSEDGNKGQDINTEAKMGIALQNDNEELNERKCPIEKDKEESVKDANEDKRPDCITQIEKDENSDLLDDEPIGKWKRRRRAGKTTGGR